MQLTLFTDYGLRTLMYLAARKDSKSNAREISDYYGISRNHLTKVIHRLALLGLVETTKGKGGGIRIATGAEELLLGDLIVELEPNMNMVECFDAETNTCRITASCQLKHYLAEATRSFTDTMNRYTLADAVKNAHILQAGKNPDA